MNDMMEGNTKTVSQIAVNCAHPLGIRLKHEHASLPAPWGTGLISGHFGSDWWDWRLADGANLRCTSSWNFQRQQLGHVNHAIHLGSGG
ncbi:hypothetical protein [Cypionkella sinensis]|uniref:hypothetical protein n=1 Tax=Cypionkella sinensis TaxID=1756043 RepID=UPI003637157F